MARKAIHVVRHRLHDPFTSVGADFMTVVEVVDAPTPTVSTACPTLVRAMAATSTVATRCSRMDKDDSLSFPSAYGLDIVNFLCSSYLGAMNC